MKLMERGQFTIPKKYRDQYGIKPGTEIDIVAKEEGLLLIKKKLKQTPFSEVYGILGEESESDIIVEKMRGR